MKPLSLATPGTRTARPRRGDLAIILSGGGARAAYQVGVLRGLSRHLPWTRPRILAGESAGAINAAYLAAHPGTVSEAVEDLAGLWSQLTADEIFRVGASSLVRSALRWGTRLMSGGASIAPEARGLLDTVPLRALLERSVASADGEITGITKNLDAGRLNAIALTTINYTTGQTVTWVQSGQIRDWERPLRRSIGTRLTIDHVLASAALPFLFPAVRLGDDWYGDGGVRLHAPLSPFISARDGSWRSRPDTGPPTRRPPNRPCPAIHRPLRWPEFSWTRSSSTSSTTTRWCSSA